MNLDVFNHSPRLKFKLAWTRTPLRGAVESPAPMAEEEEFLQNNRIESPMTATSEELSESV